MAPIRQRTRKIYFLAVTSYGQSESKFLSNSMIQYEYRDGTVYRYDRINGMPVKLLDPADYAASGPGLAGTGTSGDVLIQFIQETDGKLYYLAHSRSRDPGVGVWWGDILEPVAPLWSRIWPLERWRQFTHFSRLEEEF